MQLAYIGNFGPPHSTENHIKRALENNGHEVIPLQESPKLFTEEIGYGVDLVMWTHTHGLAPEETHPDQMRFIMRCREAGVPVISVHLDRWWGLDREHQVLLEPFFRTDMVFTADGAHREQFDNAGINHRWMPPGISAGEARLGSRQDRFASDIAFVGSWQGGYHSEHKHRAELVDWLRKVYGNRVAFWPKQGQPAVRGQDLIDLYASTKVVVGDSCLINSACCYFSDRIPETIGRGGFLLHPRVHGVTDGGLYTEGEHLDCWNMGDWDELKFKIDYWLDNDTERQSIAIEGHEHVLAHHAYEVRMAEVLTECGHLGMLP